jgi:hypothetical protein
MLIRRVRKWSDKVRLTDWEGNSHNYFQGIITIRTRSSDLSRRLRKLPVRLSGNLFVGTINYLMIGLSIDMLRNKILCNSISN